MLGKKALAALPFLALAMSGTVVADEQDEGTRTKRDSSILFYGFIRIDLAYGDSRMNDPQLAVFAQTEPDPVMGDSDDDEYSLYGKLTRIGMDFDAGEIEQLGGTVTGKIEVDFYGGGSDSRNLFRMRHAYLQIKWDKLSLLAGQTSDLISPRFPSANGDMVMWNAGNLGDRRPQVRIQIDSPFEGGGGLTFQFGIGLTGAVDADDSTAATAVLDGENSGIPMVNARVQLAIPTGGKRNLEIGLWGHVSREDLETPVAGETDFDGNSVGIDFKVMITDRIWVHGEWWTGENLDDVRGGVGQGINGAIGEIEAEGGWIEFGFKASDRYTPTVGFTFDDPEDSDVVGLATGIENNEVLYTTHTFRFGPVNLGFELHRWETRFEPPTPDGEATRFKVWIAYNF